MIGREGDLGGTRSGSGKGGKGGLIGGEGHGFRGGEEPSPWVCCVSERFGRESMYSKLSSLTFSLSFCKKVRASWGVRTMVTVGACSTWPKASVSLGSDIRSGGDAAMCEALMVLFPDSHAIVPDKEDCLDL